MASLAAAKRRRAPGQPSTPMQSIPAAAPAAPSGPLTIQQAVTLMGRRIGKLEELLNENMKAVEQKFGQQDNYIVENLPDTDAINVAFEDINQRLLTNEADIKSLPTVSESVEDSEKMQALEEKVDSKLNTLEEQVSNLDVSSRVAAMEHMIQNISSQFSELKNSVAEQSNVSNVESRTNKLEQSLEDLQATVLSLTELQASDN
jgi:hypothetical protein